jgi:ribonuclease HI
LVLKVITHGGGACPRGSSRSQSVCTSRATFSWIPPPVSSSAAHVTIYAQGLARRNPGPGGYAAVMICGPHRRELANGYRHTTQSRLELMALIAAMGSLKHACRVTLVVDSQTLHAGLTAGAAQAWQQRGWMRSSTVPAANADLWEELLRLCAVHELDLQIPRTPVKADDYERCQAICRLAAARPTLSDAAFEACPAQEPAALS